ncbi:hypothetical protein M427DRAFT_58589 [Gonapodya prolifera JEL478]|uniref:Uncharacterized protein n=1 Tax=Gonapodya prolifera (strain JEL478) TaxID=1344416 RepID=A0A139AA59_GONPJ|nr:hypothetical protein M427DRAFT_58589 [Gonapodya prolifera JEL478]|eukprot:KXS13544.1 hypothetical protein M427DRAFT_58589 [Gonapodya prolifera JEL478]
MQAFHFSTSRLSHLPNDALLLATPLVTMTPQILSDRSRHISTAILQRTCSTSQSGLSSRSFVPPSSTDLGSAAVCKTQVRGGATRGVMTGKRGNKNFYKGTGSGSMGHWENGRYVVDPWKVRKYVVPDLSDFALTPYVSRKIAKPKGTQIVPAPTVADYFRNAPGGPEVLDTVIEYQTEVAEIVTEEWIRRNTRKASRINANKRDL